MSELVELLFEFIPPERLNETVDDLLQGQRAKEVSFTGEDVNLTAFPVDTCSLFIEHGAPQTLSFKLDNLKIGDTNVSSPFAQIVFHEQGIDMSILFERKAISGDFKVFILRLQADALLFSMRHGIGGSMYGLDPAIDADTRYFTDDSLGPLMQ